MRRRAGALLVAVLAGCSGGSSRPDQLDITHEEDVDIPGGPSFGPLQDNALNAAGVGAGLSQELKTSLSNSGAKAEEIRSVKLSLLRLEVTAPLRNGTPVVDLRFLDSLEMKLVAPGQPEVVVAKTGTPATGSMQAPEFGPGVTKVDIPLLGVELKPYATASSMDATTTVKANARPALSTTVHITTIMHVELDVVGAVSSNLPLGF